MSMPYKTTSNYSMNSSRVTYSERPRIFLNILSRSNKLKQGECKLINSLSMFLDYFPDDEPHKSLEIAKTLIEAGYHIYVQNVYNSESKISACIFNTKDNIITTPKNSLDDFNDINIEINNFENSVIRVELSDYIKPKDYLMLEVEAPDGQTQSNTLIWFHDQEEDIINGYDDGEGNTGEYYFIEKYLNISLQNIYFAEGYGINIKKEDAASKFKELLLKSTLNFGYAINTSSHDIFVINNLGFINIGNHSDSIKITMKKEYITKVLAKSLKNYRALEIESKYNTDNNEIALKISKIKDYVYKLIVAKINNNKSIITETHVGSTSLNVIFKEKAPDLIQSLSKSALINIKSYSDEFLLPEGNIVLTKFDNENDAIYKEKIETSEINMFVKAISKLTSFDANNFQIYYDGNFNSLKYQRALYDIFKNTYTYGIFSYRGVLVDENAQNIAYFSDQEIFVDDRRFYTSNLSLYLLATDKTNIGKINKGQSDSKYLLKKEGVNYINIDSILTRLQLRGYFNGTMKDLRFCMIQSFIIRELLISNSSSLTEIQNALRNVKDMYSELFGIEIEANVDEYKRATENTVVVKVSFGATIQDIKDIEEINLELATMA